MDFKICGFEPADTIEVNFYNNKCADQQFQAIDGIFRVEKPGGKCKGTLDQFFDVTLLSTGESFEVHTSCSAPLHIGQVFGGVSNKVVLVGFALNNGIGWTDDSIDPCAP